MRSKWLTAVLTFTALLSLAAPSFADKLVVVAGDGKPTADVKLVDPFGVDFDRSGNLYVVEHAGGRLLKIDAKGAFSTIAGSLKQKGFEGDGGPAAKAKFNATHSLAIASNGDIYLADTLNRRVRKIDAKTGVIDTIAGTGEAGFSGDDGPAAKAKFGAIYCVALDAKAERLYLADLDNKRIRMVKLDTGIVTTVAGNGKAGVPEDGAEAAKAPLVDPRAVAADAKGNVYVLERSGHALRVVDAAGKIRTVAGTGAAGNSGDGDDARKARLNGPKHLCIDGDHNVLIADSENHVVRKYLPTQGKIVRVAGTGKKGDAGIDGPPDKAELNRPHGVYVDAKGAVFIADSENHRVVKIEK